MEQVKVSFLVTVKCLLLWIPFLLLFPFIFMTLSLLAIYKVSVIILSKLLRRHDLIRPVSGLDVFFTTDNFYHRPYGGLAFVWVINGSLSPQLIMNRLKTALVSSSSGIETTTGNSTQDLAQQQGLVQDIDNKKTKKGYEKLTSVVPIFWMGYPFWKKATQPFDIRKHVKVEELNKERFMQPDGINKLICEWMLEPFSRDLPLWEIRLVPEISLSSKTSPSDLLHESLSSVLPSSSSQLLLPQTKNDHNKIGNKAAYKLKTEGDQSNKREDEEKDGKQNCELKSILILKTHHILGDGYSMLGLLNKIIDSPVEPSSCFQMHDDKRSNLKMQRHTQMQTEKVLCQSNEHQQDIDRKISMTSKEKDKMFVSGSLTRSERKNVSSSLQQNSMIKIFTPWITAMITITLLQIIRFWLKVTQRVLCKLSKGLWLTFLIPLTLVSLVNQFVIQRDCWFTKKKETDKVSWATVCISMENLNEVRKDLCKTLAVNSKSSFCHSKCYYNDNGCRNNNDSSKVEHPIQVPITVIAVSAIAGALRRLLSIPGVPTKETKLGQQDENRSESKDCSRGYSKNCDVTANNIDGTEKCQHDIGKGNGSSIKGKVPSRTNFVIALPLNEGHPGNTKFTNFW